MTLGRMHKLLAKIEKEVTFSETRDLITVSTNNNYKQSCWDLVMRIFKTGRNILPKAAYELVQRFVKYT